MDNLHSEFERLRADAYRVKKVKSLRFIEKLGWKEVQKNNHSKESLKEFKALRKLIKKRIALLS